MGNYAKIKTLDVANGEGIRTSVFFSGCEFRCKGCFNSDISNFNVGQPCGDKMYHEIALSMNDHIAGISILGGEPLHPRNIDDVYTLCATFKKQFPDKTIWLWTGSTWEELMNRRGYSFRITMAILHMVDVLVDGRYIQDQRDLTLKWRGSRNQRVIDVQESLQQGEVVKYCK